MFYQKARELERRAPEFNRRLENWRTEVQRLQAAIDTYNRAVRALRERVERFNRDVRHYNAELDRARRLVDEINNMPPGPDRDRKIREFRQLEQWLANENNRIERERAAIVAEDTRLGNERAELERRIAAANAEKAWLEQEHATLTRLQQELDGHQVASQRLLREIEQAVGM